MKSLLKKHLVTKTVDAVVSNYKIAEYYNSLGYDATKIHSVIRVKAEELPHGSSILVKVKCDCGNRNIVRFKDYYATLANSNTYRCKSCTGRENIKKKNPSNYKDIAEVIKLSGDMGISLNGIIARGFSEKEVREEVQKLLFSGKVQKHLSLDYYFWDEEEKMEVNPRKIDVAPMKPVSEYVAKQYEPTTINRGMVMGIEKPQQKLGFIDSVLKLLGLQRIE